MRKIMGFAVVAGLGCLSFGCAAGTSAGSGDSVPVVTYQCGERIVRTQAIPGTNRIKLTLPEGRSIDLPAVEGSSGKKFSDGQVTYEIRGNESSVVFASDRKAITGCVAK